MQVATLLTLVLLFGPPFILPGMAKAVSVRASGLPQTVGGEAQTWLRATVTNGRLPELRWPDFSDYSKHLQNFYELNGYSSWWTKENEPTPQARQMIALFEQADKKGLHPTDSDGLRWSARLETLKPVKKQPAEEDSLKFELALTVCAMRYISDLHIGKVSPKRLAFAIEDESKNYDLAEFLKDGVVAAGEVAGVLAQVEPQYPGYRRTVQALQKYIEFAKQDDGELLPSVKKAIIPGDSYPGVPRLARLLRLVGDLPADASIPADQVKYEGALVSAVMNFQGRLGREPSGRIDARTVADLNVPLSQRVQQMQLTLERWRWLPSAYGKAPIVANIPEFRLRAYDQDFNIGATMKVVVGKALGHHDTPVFSDTMHYVVFRPYWEVPPSISRGELIPQIVRDPDYLAKKGFEVVDSHENVVAEGRVSSDVLDQLRAGKLSIRQKPGPKNSLGLVKFVFPNSYNVYMHDTP